jgi:hypothetical protein
MAKTYKVRVYFLTPQEGGLEQPPPRHIRIVMDIGGESLDCGMTLSGAPPHALGREYEATVEFLSPSLAEQAMARSPKFELWRGRTIGRGQILGATGGLAQG